MTREEVINQLQDAKDGYKEYLSNEALDIAIEALEQEPIGSSGLMLVDEFVERKVNRTLNKIRAEIEYTMKYQYAVGEDEYAEGFEKSLEIIDKYMAKIEN